MKTHKFTITFTLDGFVVTTELETTLDRLPGAVSQLRDIGATPTPSQAPKPAYNGAGGKSKPKTPPVFDPDGTPCCPTHNRKMKQGKFGWYCSHKEGDQYCKYSYKD